MNEAFTLQLREWLFQACLVEVLSPKPGNVGPGSEFADSTVADFVQSARVSAPILAMAGDIGVGRAILEAATATRQAVGHNTNLGILLLLAPLAAVPSGRGLPDGIGAVLRTLDVEDADLVYQAIRLAEPGGLGTAEEQDVHEPPTQTLRECMQLAADRDLIAAQYMNDFDEVLVSGLRWLRESAEHVGEEDRVTWLALRLLAASGDSLIARKCGIQASQQVRGHASAVLDQGWPQQPAGQQAYRQFDDYLRSDDNRLNPGTTADMIAAIVFAGLHSGQYRISRDHRRQIESWN